MSCLLCAKCGLNFIYTIRFHSHYNCEIDHNTANLISKASNAQRDQSVYLKAYRW